jgi:hypothetical protein
LGTGFSPLTKKQIGPTLLPEFLSRANQVIKSMEENQAALPGLN